MSGTTSGVLFETSGTNTNMAIYRGKTLAFDVIWGGAAPINITGFSASLQARNTSGDLMLDLTNANGRIVIGGANGRLSFNAPAAMTRAVDRPGHYELELVTPAGQVYRVISGKVTVVEETAL